MGAFQRRSGVNGALLFGISAGPKPLAQLTADATGQFYSGAAGEVFMPNSISTPINIVPDGRVNGTKIAPAVSGSNNLYDVTTGLTNVQGVLVNSSAKIDQVITRDAGPFTAGQAQWFNINIDSAGVVASQAGTRGTFTTAFDVAGGQPLITAGSTRLGVIVISDEAAAPIQIQEISSEIGEFASNPSYSIEEARARLRAAIANPLVHVGGITKEVHAAYNVASFINTGELVSWTLNMLPTPNSIDVTSLQQSQMRAVTGQIATWSGSAEIHNLNTFLFDILTVSDVQARELPFQFLEDAVDDPLGRWVGTARVGLETSVDADNSVKFSLSFEGVAAMIREVV